MRALSTAELSLVAGGTGQCTPSNSGGNNYGGVSNTQRVGKELIEIYEGIVAATSHIIERVANSF